MSHQHLLDSLDDKAKELAQSSKDKAIAKLITDLTHQYSNLCKQSQELLTKFETGVAEHQQYQDKSQETVEWTDAWKSKLSPCTDHTGDRYVVQNKLDRLQELQGQQKDGDSKLSHVSELNAKTQVNTSPAGIEILKRELDSLKSDWDGAKGQAEDSAAALQTALQRWKEFEETHDAVNKWLKDMEQRLKDFDLRSTLEEKQEQVEKLKSTKAEIDAYQSEVDRFTDLAQGLMESSGDTKLNTHINQATIRYQALQASIKVNNSDTFYFREARCFDHENVQWVPPPSPLWAQSTLDASMQICGQIPLMLLVSSETTAICNSRFHLLVFAPGIQFGLGPFVAKRKHLFPQQGEVAFLLLIPACNILKILFAGSD